MMFAEVKIGGSKSLSKEECLAQVQAALTGKCSGATIAQFRPYVWDAAQDEEIQECYCSWGTNFEIDDNVMNGREICVLSSVYDKEQATTASTITDTDICKVVLKVYH